CSQVIPSILTVDSAIMILRYQMMLTHNPSFSSPSNPAEPERGLASPPPPAKPDGASPSTLTSVRW
ncbi:MAG: hypothetical protein ACE5HN_10845, partial [Nitrospiria bacterium]